MRKKILTILGVCAEIVILFFLTEAVFWKAFWVVGKHLIRWFARHIHSEAAAWTSIDLIFLVSLASIILLIKYKHLRNPFVIVLTAWFIFLLNVLTFYCLLVPFAHYGP